MTSVIAHYDDGMDRIEVDMSQLGLLSGHHGLPADGLILVDVEVKNMNLKNMSDQMNQRLHYDFSLTSV